MLNERESEWVKEAPCEETGPSERITKVMQMNPYERSLTTDWVFFSFYREMCVYLRQRSRLDLTPILLVHCDCSWKPESMMRGDGNHVIHYESLTIDMLIQHSSAHHLKTWAMMIASVKLMQFHLRKGREREKSERHLSANHWSRRPMSLWWWSNLHVKWEKLWIMLLTVWMRSRWYTRHWMKWETQLENIASWVTIVQ